ncbi:nitrous oxide reductase accessory protein NosL [Rhodocyclaceae bacterium SMB388]
MCTAHRTSLSRRGFVLASAAAGLLIACGRSGDRVAAPEALAFDDSTVCVLDGLRLVDHAGPKAQIFWSDRPDPDFHCDTVEMFHVVLASGRRQQSIRALYVQDMGEADWFEPRGHWIDAKSALYVEGSSRLTAMGKTLVSFSRLPDAEAFADAHGGRILRFDDVDADMVALDGGALHDASM